MAPWWARAAVVAPVAGSFGLVVGIFQTNSSSVQNEVRLVLSGTSDLRAGCPIPSSGHAHLRVLGVGDRPGVR